MIYTSTCHKSTKAQMHTMIVVTKASSMMLL